MKVSFRVQCLRHPYLSRVSSVLLFKQMYLFLFEHSLFVNPYSNCFCLLTFFLHTCIPVFRSLFRFFLQFVFYLFCLFLYIFVLH